MLKNYEIEGELCILERNNPGLALRELTEQFDQISLGSCYFNLTENLISYVWT